MSQLNLYKENLKLGSLWLNSPQLTIGRSPTCNLVLRAPGIKHFHFLVEWAGEGLFKSFNSNDQKWIISDISGSNDFSGEGVFLNKKTDFSGFHFELTESDYENEKPIGGRIVESLKKLEIQKPTIQQRPEDLLELVQVRADSGAIEEVIHTLAVNQSKPLKLLKSTPEFKVSWLKLDGRRALKILTEELPGAEIYLKGQKLENWKDCYLKRNDLLRIHWQNRDFYLRLTPKLQVPAVKKAVIDDPLLLKLSIGGSLVALIFTFVVVFYKPAPEKAAPPPRIAKIELPAEEPPKPLMEEKSAPKTEEAKPEVDLKVEAKSKEAGSAAAPRFKSTGKTVKSGLNSPSQKSNTNTVGLLGLLGGGGPKGSGVKADQVINDGIVTSGITGEKGEVTIKNPPAGSLGSGSSGSKGGNNALAGASTTLSGGGDIKLDSGGPIAKKGGKSGYNLGNTLGGTGSGLSSSLGQGNIGLGGLETSGCLDKETVRKIIFSKKGQFQVCYERALLTHSKIQGRLSCKWNITGPGSVNSAEIAQSEIKNPSFENCILDVIRAMDFPACPTGEKTLVIYPFIFQSKG